MVKDENLLIFAAKSVSLIFRGSFCRKSRSHNFDFRDSNYKKSMSAL